MFCGSSVMRRPALWAPWIVILLAAIPALARGRKTRSVERYGFASGEWTKRPTCGRVHVNCVLYGMGKFRVLFRQGETLSVIPWTNPTSTVPFRPHAPGGPRRGTGRGRSRLALPETRIARPDRYRQPCVVPSVLDFEHPLYLVARNLLRPRRASRQRWPAGIMPGVQSLHGLGNEGFALNGVLTGNARSSTINLSRTLMDRSVLLLKPAADQEIDVELRFYADPGAAHEIKTLRLKGKPAANVSLILYPQANAARGP